tara:strand:+ start:16164 stop:16343 length:180 start_codon:yes stop_codon:yes gene_type:complete
MNPNKKEETNDGIQRINLYKVIFTSIYQYINKLDLTQFNKVDVFTDNEPYEPDDYFYFK